MASTRNNNTPGNYCLQQRSIQEAARNIMYTHAPNGEAYRTNLPGNGFGGAHIPTKQLTGNPVDTESFLRGIGANNLVNPLPTFVPELKCVKPVNIFENPAVIMPVPLVVPKNQRPFIP